MTSAEAAAPGALFLCELRVRKQDAPFESFCGHEIPERFGDFFIADTLQSCALGVEAVRKKGTSLFEPSCRQHLLDATPEARLERVIGEIDALKEGGSFAPDLRKPGSSEFGSLEEFVNRKALPFREVEKALEPVAIVRVNLLRPRSI